MFEREVALYRRLRAQGVRVSFVTYGDRCDLAYAPRLPGIRILCNRWNLPPGRYERWLLWLHLPWLLRAKVFKTNQVSGGDRALRAAQRLRKPLIARCGYLWSYNEAQQHGDDSPEARAVRSQEAQLFGGARRVVVTTPAIKATVVEQYGLPADKVTVIPNYVDTELFRPDPNVSPQPGRICFIGRLHEEKNLFALLEAVKGLPVELLLIGAGDLRSGLEAKARTETIPVRFLGNVPHTELPHYLRSAQLFVLPSHYEGHPKTLIEAMACGLPVIGADAPGIREVITHGENGWLCGHSPEEIRAGIVRVLGDPALRASLGQQARAYAESHLALDRIVQMEMAVLHEVTAPTAMDRSGR